MSVSAGDNFTIQCFECRSFSNNKSYSFCPIHGSVITDMAYLGDCKGPCFTRLVAGDERRRLQLSMCTSAFQNCCCRSYVCSFVSCVAITFALWINKSATAPSRSRRCGIGVVSAIWQWSQITGSKFAAVSTLYPSENNGKLTCVIMNSNHKNL